MFFFMNALTNRMVISELLLFTDRYRYSFYVITEYFSVSVAVFILPLLSHMLSLNTAEFGVEMS